MVLGSDSAPLPPSTDLADVVTGQDARLEVDTPALDELPVAGGLGAAAAAGDEGGMRGMLYDDGVCPDLPKDDYGATPLHRACEHGHTGAVRMLAEVGAEVDAVTDFRLPPRISAIHVFPCCSLSR